MKKSMACLQLGTTHDWEWFMLPIKMVTWGIVDDCFTHIIVHSRVPTFFSLYILYLKKHMHTSLKILDCQGPETWEHPGTQVWLGKGCDAGDDMSWSKSVLSKSSFGWFHLVGHSFIASFSASAHVRTGHIKLTDFGFAKYLKARCGAWRLLESWETRSDHLPEMAIKWPIETDGFPIKTWWFSMAMLNNQMVSYWLILSWKQPH